MASENPAPGHCFGIALCCFVLLAGGCVNLSQLSQPGLETAYYTIEVSPPAPSTTAEKIHRLIRAQLFTAPALFDSKAIVYRVKPYQTAEYVYHRWHMTPAEMTTNALVLSLRQSGLFAAVLGPDDPGRAHYTIAGHVETFLEDNTVTPWQAELALVITLLDETAIGPEARVLMQKRYAASETCPRKHPRALTEALSRAMERLSEKIMTDIHRQLTAINEPPKALPDLSPDLSSESSAETPGG